MKRRTTVVLIACVIVGVLFTTGPSAFGTEEVFITIGGGDFSGVYFPVGLAIAEIVNKKRRDYGIRATVEATTGSTFNLQAIAAGYLQFGLAQADQQYRAVKGLSEWEKKGPQTDLRAVFSIYNESLTLVAAEDAGIDTVADLKGKRVSLGNPGTSRHRIVMDTLEAAGLDPKRDIVSLTVNASEAPGLLQDYHIDAFFFTVGHPSETIRNALSSERKARMIPISGPIIDKLVAEESYYIGSTVKMHRLYPGVEGSPDNVNTFGAMATLCTSARVPQEVVYAVTKAVSENLDELRRRHPALVDLTKESMLKGLSAPLHPGALRYYREIGLVH